jgi:hypothetical protein
MKKLPLLVLLVSGSVFANSVQFNFDVNSSGASIYPCDAGLRHEDHSSSICYDRETQASCTPSTTTEDLNCICTGGTSEDYKLDNMSATVSDWSDNGQTPTNSTTLTSVAGTTGFSRLFSGDGEWAKQVRNLVFNFGSSRYGAEFYLDVCYRGPQTRSTGSGTTPNHVMRLQSTITDIAAANYSALADLQVKIMATCDLQGEGAITDVPSDDVTNNQISGISGGDISFETDYTSFASGASLILLNEWVNNGNNSRPRFCKVRFSFFEKMRTNTTNPIQQLRKWQRQQARISTLTEIAPKNSL